MIVLENVSKTFEVDGQSVTAVKNVNLNIKKGTICGIIGFSGAGKSTLVRCINLLERPSQGRVYVEGTELTALPEKALRAKRKKIGMIFQQFNLFAARTVFQNVAYPLKGSGLSKQAMDNKVKELLELVGLSDRAQAYPSQLSGGQKQRVAIARALANDPQILLSDEATSALDPQTTQSILELLKSLNEKLGLTIVVITHEMQVVKEICDDVAVMENGEIAESGDVFSIFAQPKALITRRFVDSTTHFSKVYQLMGKEFKLEPGQQLLKLQYFERSTSKALVSHISRTYALDVNIIFGSIELIGSHPMGGLIVVVSGDPTSIEAAKAYLETQHVNVEVISDERLA